MKQLPVSLRYSIHETWSVSLIPELAEDTSSKCRLLGPTQDPGMGPGNLHLAALNQVALRHCQAGEAQSQVD